MTTRQIQQPDHRYSRSAATSRGTRSRGSDRWEARGTWLALTSAWVGGARRACAGGGGCGRWRRRGRRRQATGYLRQSLALHSQADNWSGQAEALNGLGEASLATSQAGQASTRHAAALALAIHGGDKHEQARAHSGLASARQATGNGAQARGHRQALA
jgi:hypothetical protein